MLLLGGDQRSDAVSYHARKDTLFGMRQSALFEKRNSSGIHVPVSVAVLNDYLKNCNGVVHPESEALKFYYSNHVFSLLSSKFDLHEPLPPEALSLARSYVKMSGDLVARLAYYVMMIIVREMRHVHASTSKVDSYASKYGPNFSEFIKVIKGHAEGGAVAHLRNSPPVMELGKFLKGMVNLFVTGGFSSGYGGKPWSNIADTLRKMVEGEITPEMFADTAFTLVHNGGPMFNKGMLYHHQNNTVLYKLLDVQRSGQVPQLVVEGGIPPSLRPPEFENFSSEAVKLFPAELSGGVDWYKVESLGSINKYPNEKKLQDAKYGKGKIPDADGGANIYYYGNLPTDFVKVVKRNLKKAA